MSSSNIAKMQHLCLNAVRLNVNKSSAHFSYHPCNVPVLPTDSTQFCSLYLLDHEGPSWVTSGLCTCFQRMTAEMGSITRIHSLGKHFKSCFAFLNQQRDAHKFSHSVPWANNIYF